jgi:hypothetical protein
MIAPPIFAYSEFTQELQCCAAAAHCGWSFNLQVGLAAKKQNRIGSSVQRFVSKLNQNDYNSGWSEIEAHYGGLASTRGEDTSERGH